MSEKPTSYIDTVVTQAKALEYTLDVTVAENSPFVIRLDGHGFSKYTKQFQKPFDQGLADTMVAITKQMVFESAATCGYTQSDEISLVFFPKVNSPPLYGGRVQKLVSLLAGRTSVLFNHRIQTEYPEKKIQELAYFDARVIPCATDKDVHDAILFRASDGFRNGVISL